MEPLIITSALNGAEVTREQTPALPLTPVEIAEEAARARAAGAALVHIHARDAWQVRVSLVLAAGKRLAAGS
ncbi:3-keto-5-aminohexanoate cleavage protein [Ferroacidibacillus organovorans]|uniref:3-keto-5-aminohexanoate cleavage protein n=1 Tax=Ferroacidibacillus organovorans TaxID=1765683 RepID=UPI0007A8D7A4|nr:3-keto-5-aminohexanoate cleavage protein [Ferroacidibacillus organovorans]KYP81442.1 hypothetical protein AYJ22_07405 [Ferroacidibacillus organovorans]